MIAYTTRSKKMMMGDEFLFLSRPRMCLWMRAERLIVISLFSKYTVDRTHTNNAHKLLSVRARILRRQHNERRTYALSAHANREYLVRSPVFLLGTCTNAHVNLSASLYNIINVRVGVFMPVDFLRTGTRIGMLLNSAH